MVWACIQTWNDWERTYDIDYVLCKTDEEIEKFVGDYENCDYEWISGEPPRNWLIKEITKQKDLIKFAEKRLAMLEQRL